MNWKSNKTADFSRSASGCAPWRVLRLVALYESLAGVITLSQIAVLAMGLLQYCLNLSVMPPDGNADTHVGYKAHSGSTKKGYSKRNGDVECAKTGEECHFS